MNMPCRYCESFDAGISVTDPSGNVAAQVVCLSCSTATSAKHWNKPVEYRGFHIALPHYPEYAKAPLEWFDPDHDPSPVEPDDGYFSGPGDTAETLADARQQIDDHLCDLQYEEWSKENEQD